MSALEDYLNDLEASLPDSQLNAQGVINLVREAIETHSTVDQQSLMLKDAEIARLKDDLAAAQNNHDTPPEGYVLVPRDDYIKVMDFAIDRATEDQAKSLVENLQKAFPEEYAKFTKVELPTVLLPSNTDKLKGGE
jgi:hypothetical protein